MIAATAAAASQNSLTMLRSVCICHCPPLAPRPFTPKISWDPANRYRDCPSYHALRDSCTGITHLVVDTAGAVPACPALACCISRLSASAGLSGSPLLLAALLCPCLACCIRKANASCPDGFAVSPLTPTPWEEKPYAVRHEEKRSLHQPKLPFGLT